MHSLLILALTLLIPQLSFCAPLYRRDDGGCGVRHCEQILDAIGHLKGQIEEDPTGATKSWTTGNDDNNNNDDKKQKQQQQQEQQQQEAEQQQQEAEQQQQQQEEQQPEYTGGTESDNPACDATKPGQKGKFHSSGDHSTPNWDEARQGC